MQSKLGGCVALAHLEKVLILLVFEQCSQLIDGGRVIVAVARVDAKLPLLKPQQQRNMPYGLIMIISEAFVSLIDFFLLRQTG